MNLNKQPLFRDAKSNKSIAKTASPLRGFGVVFVDSSTHIIRGTGARRSRLLISSVTMMLSASAPPRKPNTIVFLVHERFQRGDRCRFVFRHRPNAIFEFCSRSTYHHVHYNHRARNTRSCESLCKKIYFIYVPVFRAYVRNVKIFIQN